MDGGAAPAYGTDVNGNNWIYVTTANGTFDLSTTGGTDAGDSFLKLNPNGLAIDTSGGPGYFTPVEQIWRSKEQSSCSGTDGDTDFGSGGPMLIPENELANWPQLAVSGDKEGGLWFVNRNSPAGTAQAATTLPTLATALNSHKTTTFRSTGQGRTGEREARPSTRALPSGSTIWSSRS